MPNLAAWWHGVSGFEAAGEAPVPVLTADLTFFSFASEGGFAYNWQPSSNRGTPSSLSYEDSNGTTINFRDITIYSSPTSRIEFSLTGRVADASFPGLVEVASGNNVVSFYDFLFSSYSTFVNASFATDINVAVPDISTFQTILPTSGSPGTVTIRVYLKIPGNQVGTLNPGVTRSRRTITFASIITDPDGIRAINSSSIRALSDGQTDDITWTRRNATTFIHSDTRSNDRWRNGIMSVNYTDGNGITRTLTLLWFA